MPPRPKLDRSIYLRTGIPESLMSVLQLHLWSPIEGRIPKGAYQEFLSARIREYFDVARLELEPFGFSAGAAVTGTKEVIEELERKLKWQE